MAADKQVSAASRRRARLSGWVLSQFQVTLAVCGIIVGFLVCFGLGFLSGVWFQTQEQMVPHNDAIALADDQLDRERTASSSGREMTFYAALTSRDGTPKPESQLRDGPTPVPKSQGPFPAASSAVASPSLPSRVPERGTTETVEPEASEPHPAEKIGSASLTVAASPRPVPSEPHVETRVSPGLKREALSTVAPEEPFYSVQVGSFRSAEQAYNLQNQLIKKGYEARIGLSIVPGNGAWYRVRVGRYADRGSADETAQRLQESEKMDVLVTRESS